MAYVPNEWATGDIITAEKLNNIENGIENANNLLVVTIYPYYEQNTFTSDKTWNEVKAAYENGKRIVMRYGITLSAEQSFYRVCENTGVGYTQNDSVLTALTFEYIEMISPARTITLYTITIGDNISIFDRNTITIPAST